MNPKECKILLTDPPLNPKSNREKMMETMFEVYGFEAMFVQIQVRVRIRGVATIERRPPR